MPGRPQPEANSVSAATSTTGIGSADIAKRALDQNNSQAACVKAKEGHAVQSSSEIELAAGTAGVPDTNNRTADTSPGRLSGQTVFLGQSPGAAEPGSASFAVHDPQLGKQISNALQLAAALAVGQRTMSQGGSAPEGTEPAPSQLLTASSATDDQLQARLAGLNTLSQAMELMLNEQLQEHVQQQQPATQNARQPAADSRQQTEEQVQPDSPAQAGNIITGRPQEQTGDSAAGQQRQALANSSRQPWPEQQQQQKPGSETQAALPDGLPHWPAQLKRRGSRSHHSSSMPVSSTHSSDQGGGRSTSEGPREHDSYQQAEWASHQQPNHQAHGPPQGSYNNDGGGDEGTSGAESNGSRRRRRDAGGSSDAPSQPAVGLKRKRATSRFMGVCWMASTGKWLAQCSSAGKQRYLGIYSKEEDAARAYDAAAVIFKGPDTPLNFPNDPPPKPLSPSTAAARATSSAQQQQQQQVPMLSSRPAGRNPVNPPGSFVTAASQLQTLYRAQSQTSPSGSGPQLPMANAPHLPLALALPRPTLANSRPRLPPDDSTSFDYPGRAKQRRGKKSKSQTRSDPNQDAEYSPSEGQDWLSGYQPGSRGGAAQRAQQAYNPPPSRSPPGQSRGAKQPWRRPPKKLCTSSYRGVSWRGDVNKWRVQLQVNGKAESIGYYSDEETAARAYDEAAVRVKGNEAVLNMPHEHPIVGGHVHAGFPPRIPAHPRQHAQQLQRGQSGSQELDGEGQAHMRFASSQFRGVSWESRHAKWRVELHLGTGAQQQVRFVGYYDNEVEAAHMHDKAVLEAEGPQAVLNFPVPQAPEQGMPAFPPPTHMSVASFNNGYLAPVGQPGKPGYGRRDAPQSQTYQPYDRLATVADGGPSQAAPGAYVGVRWDQSAGRWRADLTYNNQEVLIGHFGSQLAAAQAYDETMHAVYGPNAPTNFPLASNEAAPMHAGSLERHQGPEGSSRNPQQAQNAAPHDVQGQREHAGSVWAKAEPAQRQPGAQGGRNQVPAQQQAGQPGTAARSYHGVKFDEASRQWLAHFWHEGQAIFIGAFDTAEIAGEAHDQVALAVHGPQARLPGPPAAPADAREAAAAPHQQDEHSPRAGKQLHAGPRPGSGQAQQGSRYLGVTWKPRIQRWRASVHHTDKAAFLGDFVDKRDAALAYDRAVLELDGPNAQTNFPYSQPVERPTGLPPGHQGITGGPPTSPSQPPAPQPDLPSEEVSVRAVGVEVPAQQVADGPHNRQSSPRGAAAGKMRRGLSAELAVTEEQPEQAATGAAAMPTLRLPRLPLRPLVMRSPRAEAQRENARLHAENAHLRQALRLQAPRLVVFLALAHSLGARAQEAKPG